MNKKKSLIVIAIVGVALIAFCGWYFGLKVPHDKAFETYKAVVADYDEKAVSYNDAVNFYNSAEEKIESANRELDEAISEAQELINNTKSVYDEKTKTDLSSAVEEARKSETAAPGKKDSALEVVVTDEDSSLSKDALEAKSAEVSETANRLAEEIGGIKEEAKAISIPDYSKLLTDLAEKKKALSDSVLIFEQVTCPMESWVMSRLQEIDGVTEIAPVTEDNDPNGNLNKAGGYTSTIYFSYDKVNQNEVFGIDLIDKGTDAGGAVETYTCVEDAETREKYLAAFDGGPFSSGSHMVLGTMVVRTSDEMTASQQKELEAEMVRVLTELK